MCEVFNEALGTDASNSGTLHMQALSVGCVNTGQTHIAPPSSQTERSSQERSSQERSRKRKSRQERSRQEVPRCQGNFRHNQDTRLICLSRKLPDMNKSCDSSSLCLKRLARQYKNTQGWPWHGHPGVGRVMSVIFCSQANPRQPGNTIRQRCRNSGANDM